MELLSPAALWSLALVLLVLLARRRTARRRLAVSNLYLWRHDPDEPQLQVTLRRLRRHWLVMLQVAFMLAVIAALARPLVSWQAPRAVFIVDVSASMGARDGELTRIQLATSRAQEVLGGLPSGTLVRLISAGASPVDLGVFAVGSPALRQTIGALEATAGSSSLDEALRLAVSAEDAASATYVFTDTPSAGGDRSTPPTGAPHWFVVGHPVDNAAIVTLAARRLPASPTDGQVLAEIWNYAATPRETEVEFTQDAGVIERRRVRLAANASTSVTIDVPAIDGIIRARLVHEDALAIDDMRLARVPSLAPTRVLLATEGSFFVERALAAHPAVMLDVASPGSVTLPTAASYDVIVCDLCREVPDVTAGVLVIAPPAAGTGPLVPLALGAADHPVAEALDAGDGLVAPIAERDVPEAAVIVRAGGVPAVLAYERRGRRVVELRLDVTTPELPLMAAFPLLIANTVEWLAERDARPPEVLAGEPLLWTVRDPLALAAVTVTGPDGSPVAAQVSGRHLTITGATAPGTYRVTSADWAESFVVNPVTDGESDLARAASPLPSSSPPRVASARLGVPLALPLIVLALVLLLVEWWYRCRWAPQS